jgi:ATP-dependent DNA helicase RecQ
VYHAIGNYFELAIGSGEGFSYNFEINDFCKKFNFDLLSVYNSIGFLEKENYITATEAVFMPARIKITTTNENLYKFQVANKQFDELIKILLRSYTGLFDNYIKINETEIATRFSVSTEQLIQLFKLLESYDILSYLPASGLPQITFNTGRVDKKDLRISKENYTDRKNTAIQRMESVIYYVTTFRKCRSQMLLAYFGDENSVRCGVCDVCLERNKLELSNVEFENVSEQIKKILSEKPAFLNELVNQVQNSREDKIIKVLQWLVDNGKVEQKNNGNLVWVK